MNINNALDELFDRWTKARPEYSGKFVMDGFINQEQYKKEPIRILFIAKEPNDNEQKGGDFREWWSEEVKYGFSHCISEWA